jgi:hypothetical protein
MNLKTRNLKTEGKEILPWKHEGKKPFGRSTRRCDHNIISICVCVDWNELAQDRVPRRDFFFSAVMTFRFLLMQGINFLSGLVNINSLRKGKHHEVYSGNCSH